MKQKFFTTTFAGEEVRLGYLEAGDPAAFPVLCVHGLTRNAHDFDYLARAAQHAFRVISIDMPGRGQSSWFNDTTHYSVPTYLMLVVMLVEHLELGRFHWVGTSMGGIMGMILAAQEETQLDKLVINDIGHTVPSAALQRITAYVDLALRSFASPQDFIDHMKAVMNFPATDEHWQHIARHSLCEKDGAYTVTFDPAIMENFRDGAGQDISLTEVWEAVTRPVLLIRGEVSDVLPEPVFKDMCTKSNVTGFTVKNAGHAPSLMMVDEIEKIMTFLVD